MSICHQISSYITRLHLWQSTSHSDRHGGFHSPISRGIVESVRHHKESLCINHDKVGNHFLGTYIYIYTYLYIYIYLHLFFRHFRGRCFSQLPKGYICIPFRHGPLYSVMTWQVLDVIEVWYKKQELWVSETRWVFFVVSNAFSCLKNSIIRVAYHVFSNRALFTSIFLCFAHLWVVKPSDLGESHRWSGEKAHWNSAGDGSSKGNLHIFRGHCCTDMIPVDGKEILRSPVEGKVVYPIIYRVFYTSGVVVWDFFHQEYDMIHIQ